MFKKELRKIYKEKRLALSERDRVRLDDLLLIQFQTVALPFVHSLLSYWPIEENSEPDTHLFTEYIKFGNPELKVCYPVSDFTEERMVAVATDVDTPFTKSALNIFEPSQGEPIAADTLDIIFVPLLAFDTKGYRVGYGKGFYDKFLVNCRKDCLRIGFSYFDPVDSIDDPHEFDVPLSHCITPKVVYVF